MKLFKYILCLFCAISLTACHQDEKQDFWEATIDAVQSKSKDNAYLKNNWNIGISSDEGKKHQNMAALLYRRKRPMKQLLPYLLCKTKMIKNIYPIHIQQM